LGVKYNGNGKEIALSIHLKNCRIDSLRSNEMNYVFTYFFKTPSCNVCNIKLQNIDKNMNEKKKKRKKR